jgi:hypothetical protein
LHFTLETALKDPDSDRNPQPVVPILLEPLEATIKEMEALDPTEQTFRYNMDRRKNCTCKVLVTTIGYAVHLPS